MSTRTLIILSSAAAFLTATAAYAKRVTLNDTGLTACIDHHGDWSLDCAKSLQDAADGRDAKFANPDDGLAGFSFRKVCRSGEMAGQGSCPLDPPLGEGLNDWACVYDEVTNLTWEAKTNDGKTHDFFHSFTNKGRKARNTPTDAAWLIDATNAESLCGATNWRLPDERELQSIVNHGLGAPSNGKPLADPKYFPNTAPGRTWTNSPNVHDSKQAWYVGFDNGKVGVNDRFDELSAIVVSSPRAPMKDVRMLRKERFRPSSDGTEVTDILTGLVWRRCAEGMSWNSSEKTCLGDLALFHWKDALAVAKSNRDNGWRIPNIKEIYSIVDHDTEGVAIDEEAFPGLSVSSSFFSSTLNQPLDKMVVKYVSFFRGTIEEKSIYQDAYLSLRFVRRGRE